MPSLPCPLCAGASRLELARLRFIARVAYRRCSSCGLLFASADAGVDARFYEDVYPHLPHKAREAGARRPVFEHALDRLEATVAGRHVLDVGCGSGEFLALALARGWDAVGTEVAPTTADEARRRSGALVLVGGPETAATRAPFDLVTLWNVLDQVPDPVALLRSVQPLLAPRGRLLVRVPNGSFHIPLMRLVALLGTRSIPLGIASLTPLHPWLLRPGDLKALLAKAGFLPLEIRGGELTRGDPSRPHGSRSERAVALGKRAAGLLGRAAERATRGRLLLTPSVLALAGARTETGTLAGEESGRPVVSASPFAPDGPADGAPGPRVSVVIPSFSTERAGSLAALRTALAAQTLSSHEVLVVSGIAPQGLAINLGAQRARGEILVVLDDDSAIRDDRLLEKLVAALESDARIGMAGASVRTPGDASVFQRLAAREFPRFNVPVVDRLTDSDLACHGCAAFPLDVFRSIGGEREEITRGLDPDLRHRLREAGYRVVLVPSAVIYHPLPPTLGRFARTFVRNGRGSAEAQAAHPDLVFETDERLRSDRFVARRPFAFRVARFPLRVAWAVVTLRPLRALAYTCYAYGFLRGYLTRRLPPSGTGT